MNTIHVLFFLSIFLGCYMPMTGDSGSSHNSGFSHTEEKHYKQFIRDNFPHGFIPPKRKANGDLKVLVVGAGPGGLTAAIESYMKGVKVILLEKRPSFDREYNIQIESQLLYNLKPFFNDEDWNKWLNSLTEVRSNFQKYYRIIKIKHLQMVMAFIIEELAKRDPDNLKILFNHQFLGKDEQRQGVSIKNNITDEIIFLSTDWIVGADSLNSAVRIMAQIELVKTNDKEHYFLSVIFNNPINITEGLTRVKNSNLKAVRIVGDHNSFNFSAAVDEKLFNTYNMLKDGIEKSDFVIDFVKDYLKKAGLNNDIITSLQIYPGDAHARIFKYIYVKAIPAQKIIDINGKKILVDLIGDARSSVPFIYSGEGANNAIIQGSMLGTMVAHFLDGGWQDRMLEDFWDDFINYLKKIKALQFL